MMNMQRIVVLGDGGVGKSSIICQYMKGEIPTVYNPTLHDLHQHHVNITSHISISMEILDTAGHHRFPAMRDVAIKSGQAFLVIYAVDCRQSYEEAMAILNMIHSLKEDLQCPVVLVGNKRDVSEDLRQVAGDEAERLAAELGCFHAETMATCHKEVRGVFNVLLNKLHGVDEEYNPSGRRTSLRDRLLAIFSHSKAREGLEHTEVEPRPSSECLEQRRGSKNLFSYLTRRRKSNNNNTS